MLIEFSSSFSLKSSFFSETTDGQDQGLDHRALRIRIEFYGRGIQSFLLCVLGIALSVVLVPIVDYSVASVTAPVPTPGP